MPYMSASSYGFSSRSICAMSAAVAASGSEAMGPRGWRQRVRVCREIVCFTGRRDSFNFENRLARERRNLAPARRVSSDGGGLPESRQAGSFVRPLVFSRPAPSRAKRPAPEHGTQDREPTRRPPPPPHARQSSRARSHRGRRALTARASPLRVPPRIRGTHGTASSQRRASCPPRCSCSSPAPRRGRRGSPRRSRSPSRVRLGRPRGVLPPLSRTPRAPASAFALP
jgi:hypothetical protein